MALDGVFLGEIKKELMLLIGGRVDKIHQPSKGELLFAIRTYDGLKKLLINTVAGTARLHLTNADIEVGELLRPRSSKVVLAVNKVDGKNLPDDFYDFYDIMNMILSRNYGVKV